ncbi:DEKNAAC103587 [Brettanomyces naardenensis]|uniref:DEKNAAC103587 n=1 Tax=Brettanomyces naardenensis TaxID=13370 RepID=A0A448YP72_BRENA|nr:DEKNAAC103587 [Brettanomyces naardenensis]
MGWFKKSLLFLGGGVLAAYSYDNILGDGISNRMIRSLSTLLLISIDYKLNFDQNHDVARLHERNAERLYNLVIGNKGMYIKLGQMIAIQGFMFPTQYQEKFKLMFDQAPEESWATCDSTLRKELGDNYREEIFSSIEEKPIASASIAQVHRGVLKSNGQKVAVKIQKTTVSKQVDADLFTYRAAMKIYQWVFGMPLATVATYVSNKTREELDFVHELSNAQKISNLVESDPEFKGKVYIPRYYPEISTGKVLIGEWIDGDTIGEYMKLKDKGYNIKTLMDSIIRVYSRQVFSWGVVHCDLHPGNLIVRMVPDGNGKTHQQLVILDHGLYEIFSDKFKKEYSEFWKYTMEKDLKKVKEVMKSWGINADDLMMSAAGMGDPNSEQFKKRMKEIHDMSYYDRQVILKQQMKKFLENSDLFPMCLAFVMRSMRIVQGLNRNFGSPCNRIGILVAEANRTVQLYAYTPPTDLHDYVQIFQRNLTYYAMQIFTFLTFEFNRILKFVNNEVLHSRTNKVKDLEEMYEDNLVEAGESMGFEKVPSTDEILTVE